ncbi:MAG: RNA-binding transcriptional accessory protein [Candidatus Omnitrophica bacterium]|nr:RNA-binding transcriptional accessory protein [Candidatus Omnitrophota bacterium]
MDNASIIKHISKELNQKISDVNNTVELLDEGATIPFISRYRKEKTGGLNEIVIRSISEKWDYYRELGKRKETIIKTITEQGKLTPELQKQITECLDKNKLEDIYLPFKPKKRTRAAIAKEKGLAPLADIMLKQEILTQAKEQIVEPYINPEKQVNTYEDAIKGACDIIAETISDDASIRGWVRKRVWEKGVLHSQVKKQWADKESKFQNYYEFRELLKKAPSHRVLAIRRGTQEEVLNWKIDIEKEMFIDFIKGQVIKNPKCLFKDELENAVVDSFQRLIFVSIELEAFVLKIEEAGKEAINVFSDNMHKLLLAAPAGNKVIMGIDPGFRTGCKVVVIDAKGDFKEFTAIYPHEQKRQPQAEEVLIRFIKKYNVELIAIGNGTASKETDIFIRQLIKKHKLKLNSVVVSEAGASVYSASEVAAREFPDADVTVRGAISIARRLQDPLAELVKIDPKSIGVGQYQHDVSQHALKRALDLTVESCVNYVGVELNTASCELLSFVSGIGRAVAKNIVDFRKEKGPFKSRKELLKVSKLGPKAFEQSAGFLRIRDNTNPLDNSAIHPEAYSVVEKMAKDHNVSLEKIIGDEKLIASIEIEKYISDDFGVPTLEDILKELKKPGRDPRREFKSIIFSDAINTIEDLSVGMTLDGVITNVTNFGAFVDIGVHQDGLIHISQLSDSYVRNPQEIVSVGDEVKVEVLKVEIPLKRIALKRLKGKQ